jgi:hypothetical protein
MTGYEWFVGVALGLLVVGIWLVLSEVRALRIGGLNSNYDQMERIGDKLDDIEALLARHAPDDDG